MFVPSWHLMRATLELYVVYPRNHYHKSKIGYCKTMMDIWIACLTMYHHYHVAQPKIQRNEALEWIFLNVVGEEIRRTRIGPCFSGFGRWKWGFRGGRGSRLEISRLRSLKLAPNTIKYVYQGSIACIAPLWESHLPCEVIVIEYYIT